MRTKGLKRSKHFAEVICVCSLALHVLVGDGQVDDALDDLPGVEPRR